MMTEFTVGDGRYLLNASVARVGADLTVTIYGGERPHVGAVAVAYTGADNEVALKLVEVGSHREGAVVEPAALRLARALNCTVIVSAGMHWDQIDRHGIDTVLENAHLLVEEVLRSLQTGRVS